MDIFLELPCSVCACFVCTLQSHQIPGHILPWNVNLALMALLQDGPLFSMESTRQVWSKAWIKSSFCICIIQLHQKQNVKTTDSYMFIEGIVYTELHRYCLWRWLWQEETSITFRESLHWKRRYYQSAAWDAALDKLSTSIARPNNE